jgi:hypothetical protein
VDSRRAQLQIRLVLAAYRAEVGGDSDMVARLRDRAEAILRQLEPIVAEDAGLTQRLAEARRELRGGRKVSLPPLRPASGRSRLSVR